MSGIGSLLIFLLDLYLWVIIISVVLSWLVVFDVINVKNSKAQSLMDLLSKLTEPVFGPIRNVIKPIGGIDISPIIVILGIFVLQQLIASLFFRGVVHY